MIQNHIQFITDCSYWGETWYETSHWWCHGFNSF